MAPELKKCVAMDWIIIYYLYNSGLTCWFGCKNDMHALYNRCETHPLQWRDWRHMSIIWRRKLPATRQNHFFRPATKKISKIRATGSYGGGIQRWPMNFTHKRVALNVESLSMSCCLSTYLQSFLLQDTRSERVQSPPCRHSGPPRTNPGHLCWRPSQTPLDQRSHRFPLETGTGTGPWTFHWGLSRKWLPRWPRWAECRRHWSWTDCLLGQFVKGPLLWLGGGAADLKQSQAEYG